MFLLPDPQKCLQHNEKAESMPTETVFPTLELKYPVNSSYQAIIISAPQPLTENSKLQTRPLVREDATK
jgi:hypothetical protein